MKVAITGGTGSGGRAFTKMFLDAGSERVVVVSRDEVKQAEMAEVIVHPHVRFMLGDVRDQARMQQVFTGCDTVVHAAALKRVQSVYSQTELVKTNIMGTMSVIDAALAAGVRKVLLISSDKAVEATNQYGVTKAAAEGIAVHANSYTVPRGMAVSVVRYGNVLGSRGSVLEIWQKQVNQGQPLTLTHPDMSRFLLTLDEAGMFVRQALGSMEGGEIFVPVLPATTMMELLNAVYPIRLGTILTGLRSGGEKMYETLVSEEERTRITLGTDDLWIVAPSFHSWRAHGWPIRTLHPYTSRTAQQLMGDDLQAWLKERGF